MKLLYLNEHLSCLNYQMNSDVGFTCQQLEKDEVYRIDNSKSSCTLFIIEGDVIFDLGKYKGLRILQNQMVFIPQNIGTRMKSITGSECMLLFWDRNMSVCDKLFLGSLSVRGRTERLIILFFPSGSLLLKCWILSECIWRQGYFVNICIC